MGSVAGHAVEFHASEKAHGHAKLATLFDHALQANVVRLLRHADPLKSPSPGLERLRDGIDAIDIVHKNSLPVAGGQLPASNPRVSSVPKAEDSDSACAVHVIEREGHDFNL